MGDHEPSSVFLATPVFLLRGITNYLEIKRTFQQEIQFFKLGMSFATILFTKPELNHVYSSKTYSKPLEAPWWPHPKPFHKCEALKTKFTQKREKFRG